MKNRIKKIIKVIPHIKALIKLGYKWDVLKSVCQPLGLNDTAFRDYPNINDYLLDIKYWKNKFRGNIMKNQSLHVNINCKDSMRCFPHGEQGEVFYRKDKDIIKECQKNIKQYKEVINYIKKTKAPII